MELLTFPGAQELASAAADRIREVAAATGTGRRVSIGLAGGSTPAATYRELARAQPSWAGVDLWLSDERWVPLDHPDSNGRMAVEILGSSTRIRRPRYSEFLTAVDSAAHYEALLRHIHGDRPPDLVLLGMGTDGHTASLFPGSAGLQSEGRIFIANWLDDASTWRLTATFDWLEAAAEVMLLVSGRAKAEILAAAVDGPAGRYPVQRILARRGRTLLYADEDAASLLARS